MAIYEMVNSFQTEPEFVDACNKIARHDDHGDCLHRPDWSNANASDDCWYLNHKGIGIYNNHEL